MTDRKVIGDAKCPVCGFAGCQARVNVKGHVYIFCAPDYAGGCSAGTVAHAEKSDRLLARFVTKWRGGDERKKYLGDDVPARSPVKVVEVRS